MTVKKARLGRGLEELAKGLDKLIPKPQDAPDAAEKDSGFSDISGQPLFVNPDLIDLNPDQPRRLFIQSELESLASSIREHGLIEPLIVSKKANGRFELIAGERRLKAAKLINIDKISIIIRDLTEEPAERLILALVENLHREDLNPIEEAESFARLENDFGKTHQEIALMAGRERSSVTNSVRLLKLPEAIINDIANRRLTSGQGKALLGLLNDHELMSAARNEILAKNLSVRQTELLVRRLKKKRTPKEASKSDQDYYEALGRSFSERLKGLKVKINYDARVKKIEIFYGDVRELESLMACLGVEPV